MSRSAYMRFIFQSTVIIVLDDITTEISNHIFIRHNVELKIEVATFYAMKNRNKMYLLNMQKCRSEEFLQFDRNYYTCSEFEQSFFNTFFKNA